MALLDIMEKMVGYCYAAIPQSRPSKEAAAESCLIAHRGAHDKKRGIIENTHAAFSRALALGCWGIELDVHATADNVLVVHHDPDLQRLWGKKLRIPALSFQELRQLAPAIPTLDEVIECYGKKMHLFIELKAPFQAEAALETSLESLTACQDYHLLSLKEPIFSALTGFPHEAMLLVAVHNNVNLFCQDSLKKSYGGVLGHYLLMGNKTIQNLLSAQQQLGVGMVDSRLSLYRELNRGIRWIFTNNVRLLSTCLEELREA